MESRWKRDQRFRADAIFAIAFAASLITIAVGCGAKQDPNRLPVYPVTGKVTFQGKPPAGAFLVLHPKSAKPGEDAVRPRAYVKDDGTFELSSYEASDGAPVGEYAVTVEWRKLVKYRDGDVGPGKNLIPRQYSRPEFSPVTLKIAEGPNQLNPIVLK